MASSLRRAVRARHLLAGLAAAALPLLAAGSAQAALTGGIPLTTQQRPDLRTVTLLPQSASTPLNVQQVEYCFDKTLTLVPSPTLFFLNGYEADNPLQASTAAIETGKPTCVVANFPTFINATSDFAHGYTIGTVGEGAVQTAVASALTSNRADSTALTVPGGSNNNGTTGHTTGPDLTGVQQTDVTAANTLTYVFDQNIDTTQTINPANFHWVVGTNSVVGAPASGTDIAATNVQAAGNVVRATFPIPAGFTGTIASLGGEAYVLGGAIATSTASHRHNQIDSAPIQGTSGDTSRADLQTIALSGNGLSADFCYDRAVILAAGMAPSQFQMITSDGGHISATLASSSTQKAIGTEPSFAPSANCVRAFFPATGPFAGSTTSTIHEYYVKGVVTANAVTVSGVPGTVNNYPQSAPAGDNAGASAYGFTTGPDAFNYTTNLSLNTITITFDQRVFCPTAAGTTSGAGIVLLDANGTALPGGTGSSLSCIPLGPNGTSAGAFQVTVSFTGANVGNAQAVEIHPGAVATSPEHPASGDGNTVPPGSGGPVPSVQQILGSVGTAARLKHAHWVKFTTKHNKHGRAARHH
jgi:hypothetical protein